MKQIYLFIVNKKSKINKQQTLECFVRLVLTQKPWRMKKIMDNKQKGYSMTELMVVVSIIGILGVIAVPNFVTSVSTHKLKNTSVDLCSNLRKARSIAIKQNRNVAISFNTDAKTYSIDNGSPVRLEEGISFGKGTATVSANPGESIPSDGISFAVREGNH